MVSALDSGSGGSGSGPGRGTVLCSWARHSHSASLHPGVPANLLLGGGGGGGVTLRWTSIPSRGEYSESLNLYPPSNQICGNAIRFRFTIQFS